jgi:hypothetical protein
MGAACGSAKDSSKPGDSEENGKNRRSNDRRLTSLDDIINIKQRRSSEVRLTNSEKKKLYERKFSVKKEDL